MSYFINLDLCARSQDFKKKKKSYFYRETVKMSKSSWIPFGY